MTVPLFHPREVELELERTRLQMDEILNDALSGPRDSTPRCRTLMFVLLTLCPCGYSYIMACTVFHKLGK